MKRSLGRLLIGAFAGLAPWVAFAQLTISPPAPQMLDPVRLGISRLGTFTFDADSVRIQLADGKFTVHVLYGAALSPPPPPSTFYVLLGQLPIGTYQVDVVLDTPIPSSLGTTSFTVGPRKTGLPTYSDLWWNSAESGWGVNIIQHPSGTFFATLFVYESGAAGAAGAVGPPRWYVMPSGTWWPTLNRVTGDLYRTTGPQALDSFDPSAVLRTKAGTAMITFNSPVAAAMTVTIDGRTVGKMLQRQPF